MYMKYGDIVEYKNQIGMVVQTILMIIDFYHMVKKHMLL